MSTSSLEWSLSPGYFFAGFAVVSGSSCLWNRNSEDGAFLRRLRERDVASVLLRDLPRQGEAEADAALASFADEWEKDGLLDCFRNSRAVVGDPDMDRILVFDEAE
jgi:hypothetical protein